MRVSDLGSIRIRLASPEEILSWIWAYRPDLGSEILGMKLSEDFKILIESYNSSDMQKFWDYVS